MSSSQQNPSPHIWFQPVDSITGLPFKGASASFVLRNFLPVPIVDRFLDAVKWKCSDSELKGIAPSALKVYENRAAFDKRSIADARLNASFVLDGIGEIKEDALIVVVPSAVVVPLASFGSSASEDQVLRHSREFTPMVHLLAKFHIKSFEYLSDAQTKQSDRDPHFKSRVHEYYYKTKTGDKTKCMITGFVLPTKVVMAGHLFKRDLQDDADELVGMKDIDDPRNGMLMYNPIQQAFDTSIISLVSCGVHPKGNVRVVVRKRELLKLTIGGYIDGDKSLKNQNLKEGVPSPLLSTTFADLEKEIDYKVVIGGPNWYSSCWLSRRPWRIIPQSDLDGLMGVTPYLLVTMIGPSRWMIILR